MIDLRSDTVTKPTPEMRKAMSEAEVGDDVYGEDPTVNRLQENAAQVFEKEAGLFVPSGSMGNQIAIKVHTQPGQEAIIEERGHIYKYEMGGPASIAGVTMRPVKSREKSGMLTWDEIVPALQIGLSYHTSSTSLICLENTHNFGGGSVMSAAQCADICDNAHKHGLRVHMDGARIFNAAITLKTPVAELTRECDSVQFCLSKGLGAPVGSMLVGSVEFIEQARMWRKRLGGGMRQVGILAAAGLIALEESPKRLHEDHANARFLADRLAEIDGIEIDPESVATNIVIFGIAKTGNSAEQICLRLASRGVLSNGFGTSIRMVTHCDVSRDQIERAVKELRSILS